MEKIYQGYDASVDEYRLYIFNDDFTLGRWITWFDSVEEVNEALDKGIIVPSCLSDYLEGQDAKDEFINISENLEGLKAVAFGQTDRNGIVVKKII